MYVHLILICTAEYPSRGVGGIGGWRDAYTGEGTQDTHLASLNRLLPFRPSRGGCELRTDGIYVATFSPHGSPLDRSREPRKLQIVGHLPGTRRSCSMLNRWGSNDAGRRSRWSFTISLQRIRAFPHCDTCAEMLKEFARVNSILRYEYDVLLKRYLTA